MHATLPATWRLPTIPWALVSQAMALVGIAYVVAVQARVAPYGDCGSRQMACDAASTYFSATPYDWSDLVNGASVYRYSPAFLWLVAPLRLLSWDAFQWVWLGLHIVALLWLRAAWMLALPGLNEDLIRGNTSVFIAVAVVLAVRRWPAAWAFVLLTKITPAVGMVWHLVRREWTALAISGGVMVTIIASGFLVDPQLWRQWFGTLLIAEETYEIGSVLGPHWLRLLLAVGLVAYAARTDRAWLIAPAMVLAAPGTWPYVWMLLAAVPRLLENRQSRPERITVWSSSRPPQPPMG